MQVAKALRSTPSTVEKKKKSRRMARLKICFTSMKPKVQTPQKKNEKD
jgi:hypothetical protein